MGVALDSHPHPLDSLRIEIPAIADRLIEVRSRLLAWLALIGVADVTAADIVLVINEACSNSIEHAYRGADTGLIRVEVAREGEHIVASVSDFGSWQTPRSEPTTRGRGLAIMRAITDEVELVTSAVGTTIRTSFDVPDAG